MPRGRKKFTTIGANHVLVLMRGGQRGRRVCFDGLRWWWRERCGARQWADHGQLARTESCSGCNTGTGSYVDPDTNTRIDTSNFTRPSSDTRSDIRSDTRGYAVTVARRAIERKCRVGSIDFFADKPRIRACCHTSPRARVSDLRPGQHLRRTVRVTPHRHQPGNGSSLS
jgi:hypothetical protein